MRIDRWGRIFDLMPHLQDGGHEVISVRKVLPSGRYYADRQQSCLQFSIIIIVIIIIYLPKV